MEIPKELKKIASTLVAADIVKAFGDLCEASMAAGPEIREFVKHYEDTVIAKGQMFQTIFGDDVWEK
jgi:hypothetical protein